MPVSTNAGGTLLVLVSTALVMLIGLGIAIYFQRRTKTVEDWAVGSRQLPSYVIVFTQFATLVGGGVLVGHVGIGFDFGHIVHAVLVRYLDVFRSLVRFVDATGCQKSGGGHHCDDVTYDVCFHLVHFIFSFPS